MKNGGDEMRGNAVIWGKGGGEERLYGRRCGVGTEEVDDF